ncbi:unannotated protein [freshwater metagenome]|uniref:Unannotated protein n=1 Tax=freshwater metagenome TaxID=449393 RepID=A0A6J6Q901_9ZZZZ
MLSSRSISMATQPMPPSDIAIFRFGNSTAHPAQSHSTQAVSDNCPNRVAVSGIATSQQPSGRSPSPEEPTCRLITVSVSAQARRIGSQYRSNIDGRPKRCGRSGSVTVRNPRAALRRISAAPNSGSVRKVMPSGMVRSGYGCHHSSCIQSFHARVTARPSAGSEHCEYTRPQKPVIIEGKLSEAHTPLMSISRTRSWISQQPRRIWSNRKGSTLTVSRRRPATAFMPTWLYVSPSNFQT